ncbi:MAG: AMP-binding protein, partial [Candidatus Ornithospirochaeta sp.]
MSRKVYYTQVDFLESYRGKAFSGEWPTITEAFSITVSRFPNNEALKSITPSVFSLTFKEAYEKISEIAYFIKENGISPGDKLAVCGKNSPQWALAYLAITYSGAVIVPLDHGLKSDEMKKLIEFGDVKGIFADGDRIDVDVPTLHFRVSLDNSDNYPYIMDIKGGKCGPEKVACNDTAAILFTSGTT